MRDDETAGSSFLLAQHDTAHREHSPQHQRLHRSLHKKHANVNVGKRTEEAVTEIVATISIIQQINVDVNGNTLAIKTIQTHLAPLAPAAITEAPLPSPPALPSLSLLPEGPNVPIPASSQTPSSPDSTSVSTSSPSDTTTFPSLVATANSTLLSNSSSLPQNFTNSSRTSTSSSYLSPSRSTSLFKTSSDSTDASTSFFATASAGGGVVATGTGIISGAGAESTSNSEGGNSSNDGTPPTPVVVGGVIGSIAGAAVLIVALLFIIRWRKRSKGMLSLGSGTGDDRNEPSNLSSGPMTERRNVGFGIPAVFASLTNKHFSQKRDVVDPTPAGGERGFYRVSGRKLPSVLQTGGDGYGGGFSNGNTMSGSSFYQDSQGHYSGGGPSSPPLDMLMNRESTGGVPIFRPSPARTPTREESPFSLCPENTPPPLPIKRPDVLGRSHASQDGSHTSRFTEEV